MTSQDLKKEILTSMKFNRDNWVDKLDLVTRDELVVLKKIIEKQQKEIQDLKKNKKFKKAKKS